MKNLWFKKGFTLAEVLLTLTIVGIVAALTIPSLVSSTRDQELKAAWKKTYSDLSQATSMLIYDNSGSIKGLYNNEVELLNAYKPYLAKSKECMIQASSEGCSPSEYRYLYGPVYPANWLVDTSKALVLNNGAIVYFGGVNKNCIDNDSTYITNRCTILIVDVNGKKSPNVLGKDLFQINLFHNRMKPRGCQGDPDCNDWWTPENSCNPGVQTDPDWQNSGLGCAAKYLKE